MNSDKVKGTIDDAAGRAKRQVGEWTGDTDAQVEGAGQQVKGKAEKVIGDLRDAVKDAKNDMNRNPANRNPQRTDDDRDRESDVTVHRNP